MTFEQIKFAKEMIRKFENQKKETCYEAMDSLLDKTRFYFTEIDFNKLYFYTYNTRREALSHDDFVSDSNAIIFTLEGMLAKDKNYPLIKHIIQDIEMYKRCKSDKSVKEAIKKIFYSYSGEIKFNKVIEKIIIDDAKNTNFINFNNGGFDKTLLDGMLVNLETYANEICFNGPHKDSVKKERKQETTININNNNNFNANTSVDLVIENTIEELENACLSDEQETLVKEKIKELEDIIQSKESKKIKWRKFGSILKWVAEQGLQVASIIVPLISCALK